MEILNSYSIVWICVGVAGFTISMGIKLCINEALRRR